VKVRAYVIATDAGSAPNYDPPCTTLAVCKPRIRQAASIGDLVLAYAGSNVNPHDPHAVVWAGVVSEKLTFAEYWTDQRFQTKKPERSPTPDNFYRPVDGGLLQVPNRVHGPEHFNRDTGGLYVLAFDPSWRFGAHGPRMPTEFGLQIPMTARRAGRVAELTHAGWLQLETWLNEQELLSVPGLARPSGRRRCRPPSPRHLERPPRKPHC